MKRTFYVNNIPDSKVWETCFHFLMEKSDTFQIILQGTSDPFDADDMLNTGKKEFLSLPSISISPYKGMANSIKVTGELNIVARELFLTFLAPDKPNLWSFQFLQEGNILLEVADFTEGWLHLGDSEVEDLQAQGVAGLNVLEVDSVTAEIRLVRVTGHRVKDH